MKKPVLPDIIRNAHPARAKLLSYAERLAEGTIIGECDVARHIAECERCDTEVHAMLRSFGLIESLPELQPSRRSTAGILLAARHERHRRQVRAVRVRRVVRVSKGLSVAAAAVVVVNFALEYEPQKPAFRPAVIPAGITVPIQEIVPAAQTAAELPEPEVQESPAETLLWDAVVSTPAALRTGYEDRTRRAVQAYDASIYEAIEELKRNPALAPRVKQIVTSNKKLRNEELKSYFAERPL